MNKKKIIIIISIIVGALVIASLYGTFASETAMNIDNVYNIVLTGNSNEVSVPAGSSKTVIYQVTNTNKGKVNYGITYAGENIEVKIYEDSIDKESGLIDYGETKFIKLRIINTGTTDSTASVKVVLGFENDSNLNVPNLVPSGHVFVSEVYFSKQVNLINFIKKKYTSGKPELITHSKDDGTSDTYYYSYQDDNKSWGLMNDGLKTDTSLDATTTGFATTVTSTEALTSGTEGNIRYFGPSDKVNNYIYFNCSDYSNQSDSTCEKWRIIGIVDGKVKIIRNESIDDLAWDYDKNQNESLTTYNNNWKDSSLQEFLNGLYYNRGTIESHPYYSGSDGSTKTTLNLKTIGITEATRNNNLISESTWYLGGYSTSEIYPNQIYAYERTNKKGTTVYSTNDFTIQKNIGLMYPSDFGYGTDLTKCSEFVYNYYSDINSYACRANNWLFNSAYQWLITPDVVDSSYVWLVHSSGHVGHYSDVYRAYGVRPVLYLEENVVINDEGDGTSANPYQIYVETKLIDYITNLYVSGNPEPITHKDTNGNQIADYYYSYQDGNKDWGLMNDGLKISSDSSVGSTAITDIDALTSGTEGNIRYFGPSDKVNNYIYFNCDKYPDTNCELWRIIGIVDGKVKLIRQDLIGHYAWDNKNTNTEATSNNGSNNWSDARLMRLLNNGYENFVDKDNSGNELIANNSLYWIGGSGTCYLGQNNETMPCEFTGIKDTTKKMISKSIWYLGGGTGTQIYPNNIYTYERTNSSSTIYNGNSYTINANVGLMYASDYGYGTNLTRCSQTLINHNSSTDSYACRENNWLFKNSTQWLITTGALTSYSVWYANPAGHVSDSNAAYDGYGVRPTLYLDSELVIESGHDGTSADPYRIKVS